MGLVFRILGPLEVENTSDLGGPKPRTLLARLLLEPNRVVSYDELIEAVWPDEPPRQARHTLQVYVSSLRRALGEDRIRSDASGYSARVGPTSSTSPASSSCQERAEHGCGRGMPRARSPAWRRRSPCGAAHRSGTWRRRSRSSVQGSTSCVSAWPRRRWTRHSRSAVTRTSWRRSRLSSGGIRRVSGSGDS